MAVTNVHIFYMGTSAFDLRKVISWYPHRTDATQVSVRFQGIANTPIDMNTVAFEAAKQASVTAGG